MSDFQIWKFFFQPVCLERPFCHLTPQVSFSHSWFRSRSEMYICILENSGLSNSIYTVLLLGSWLIFFSHCLCHTLIFDITFVPWTSNGAHSLSEFVPGCFLRQSQDVFTSLWIAVPLWYLTCFLIAEVSRCCDLLLFHLCQFCALSFIISQFFLTQRLI